MGIPHDSRTGFAGGCSALMEQIGCSLSVGDGSRHTGRGAGMLVTATQIADWANTRDAQASLPRLIRRLVCRNASITQVAIPAGDSVNAPGWDGEVRV